MNSLHDQLMRASAVLHWLGKYDVANALILFARFLRASNINTLDEFERILCGAEDGTAGGWSKVE